MRKNSSLLLQGLTKTELDPMVRRQLRLIAWVIALLLGLLQALAHYQEISSTDCISYLDIGDAYFRHDLKPAINSSWSPLYSWVLGAAIYVVRPSAYWEFPLVNLISFIIFVFALLSFEFFLSRLIHDSRQSVVTGEEAEHFFVVPEAIWLIAGYTIFLWA